MKKILLASAALGAALAFGSAAYAGPAKSFDGPYVGVEAGVGVSNTSVPAPASADLYGQGAFGGIFAGYGKTFNSFYVGGEANGSFGNIETEDFAGTLEKNLGYGVAARAGYVLGSSTLGYGVLGWERGRFELKDTIGTEKDWVDGLRLGAGVEQGVSDSVSLRGELNFVKWQDKDFSYDVEAHEINAKVGLSYRFN